MASKYTCFQCAAPVPQGLMHMCRPEDIESRFDQRPGDLEATRGLALRHAQGDRDIGAAFMVWAEKQADGWKVRVKVDAALSSEDAFTMAAEIQRLADLIEGRAEF